MSLHWAGQKEMEHFRAGQGQFSDHCGPAEPRPLPGFLMGVRWLARAAGFKLGGNNEFGRDVCEHWGKGRVVLSLRSSTGKSSFEFTLMDKGKDNE